MKVSSFQEVGEGGPKNCRNLAVHHEETHPHQAEGAGPNSSPVTGCGASSPHCTPQARRAGMGGQRDREKIENPREIRGEQHTSSRQRHVPLPPS